MTRSLPVRTISAICLALAMLAAGDASAQRGSSGRGGIGGMLGGRGGIDGTGGRRGGGGVNREAPIKLPAASELQRFNPAALLIDKRRKVTLADSQVTALIEIRNMINERNAPLLARYDSIRKDFSPPKPQDRDRVGFLQSD